MLFERAQAKRLKLIVETSSCPPGLLGDPTRLQQALLNYATNAMKFTERGTRAAPPWRRMNADGVLVRFEVRTPASASTRGDGQRLFATFEQADNSTTRKYGGTGLGTCHHAAPGRTDGRSAGVDSDAGRRQHASGSAPTWRRAAAEAVAAPSATRRCRAAIRSPEADRRRILLVEDDPMNREIAVVVLEDAGLIVDAAADGDIAVRDGGGASLTR
jgi:CheY-like chemotaxis protein